jgi:hypothetical protein
MVKKPPATASHDEQGKGFLNALPYLPSACANASLLRALVFGYRCVRATI